MHEAMQYLGRWLLHGSLKVIKLHRQIYSVQYLVSACIIS